MITGPSSGTKLSSTIFWLLQFTTKVITIWFFYQNERLFNEDFRISITGRYGHCSVFTVRTSSELWRKITWPYFLFLAQALANPTPTAKRCKPGWKSPTPLRSYKRRRDIQRPHFKQVTVHFQTIRPVILKSWTFSKKTSRKTQIPAKSLKNSSHVTKLLTIHSDQNIELLWDES